MFDLIGYVSVIVLQGLLLLIFPLCLLILFLEVWIPSVTEEEVKGPLDHWAHKRASKGLHPESSLIPGKARSLRKELKGNVIGWTCMGFLLDGVVLLVLGALHFKEGRDMLPTLFELMHGIASFFSAPLGYVTTLVIIMFVVDRFTRAMFRLKKKIDRLEAKND